MSCPGLLWCFTTAKLVESYGCFNSIQENLHGLYCNYVYMILPVEKFFHNENNSTEEDYNSFIRIKYLQVFVLHKLDTFGEEGISNMLF